MLLIILKALIFSLLLISLAFADPFVIGDKLVFPQPTESFRFMFENSPQAIIEIRADGRVFHYGKEIGTDPEIFLALKDIINGRPTVCDKSEK